MKTNLKFFFIFFFFLSLIFFDFLRFSLAKRIRFELGFRPSPIVDDSSVDNVRQWLQPILVNTKFNLTHATNDNFPKL
jgi:hypothetical protein